MLDTLITSRVRRKIIERFLKYPDYKTHIRGLSSSLSEDVGNVYRELRKLEKAGLLTSIRQNNTKIYTINRQQVCFRELQLIVLKSRVSVKAHRAVSS